MTAGIRADPTSAARRNADGRWLIATARRSVPIDRATIRSRGSRTMLDQKEYPTVASNRRGGAT